MVMASEPKVSVCMPTYNQGRYLRQALESVLRQKLQDFEIVVFDDASTDETPEIVAAFHDERIRYFRQERNVGIAANRNSCIAKARGRYLAWLDSDDVYLTDMLAVQSAILETHPNVGLVHGAFEVIDHDGRRLPDWPLPFKCDVIEPGPRALRELVLQNYITAPTVMVRRACFDRVGRYATELSNSGEDWEMWLRIALHADIAYTATAVAQYRQHKNSSSSFSVKNGDRLRNDFKVLQTFLKKYAQLDPDNATLRNQAHAALAVKALILSGERFTRKQYWAASRALLVNFDLAKRLLRNRHGRRLLISTVSRNEFANYRHSKALMSELYSQLASTAYAEKIKKLAVEDPEWQNRLRKVAGVIRKLVPEGARLAAVDKSDPTLLHLCDRKGWHFPDWSLLPDGYPRDSRVAIKHLEQLRSRGADYIVFPSAAFWWLEFYEEFNRHLNDSYTCLWRDDNCVVYELRRREAVTIDSGLVSRMPQARVALK
jgi:glycosyltransferase involved in cell wall biosynthesis